MKKKKTSLLNENMSFQIRTSYYKFYNIRRRWRHFKLGENRIC